MEMLRFEDCSLDQMTAEVDLHQSWRKKSYVVTGIENSAGKCYEENVAAAVGNRDDAVRIAEVAATMAATEVQATPRPRLHQQLTS